MKLPVSAFLERLASTAAVLWSGREMATTGWRRHRECDIVTLDVFDVAALGWWGSVARGLN